MALSIVSCFAVGDSLIVTFTHPSTKEDTPQLQAQLQLPAQYSLIANGTANSAQTLDPGLQVVARRDDTNNTIVTIGPSVPGLGLGVYTIQFHWGPTNRRTVRGAVTPFVLPTPTDKPLDLNLGPLNTAIHEAGTSFQNSMGSLGTSVERAIGGAFNYPLFTEGIEGTGVTNLPAAGGPGGTGSFGAIAERAVQAVLNWRGTASDPKGFVAALGRTIELGEDQGHVTWKVNTSAALAPADVSDELVGAQYSLYLRGKESCAAAKNLIGLIRPLNPVVDQEDAAALVSLLNDLFDSLPAQLAASGGPLVLKVDEVFTQLLGSKIVDDPDSVAGVMGDFRTLFGLSTSPDFVNTETDELYPSYFRAACDYLTSLRGSWNRDRQYFVAPSPNSKTKPRVFFGTQLVLISRQLQNVGDAVRLYRVVLESVFIGAPERRTMEFFTAPSAPSSDSFVLEDFLDWAEDFSSGSGMDLLKRGGKYSVQSVFLPTVVSLHGLAVSLKAAQNSKSTDIPQGFFTGRARNSLDNLAKQLDELRRLAAPITHTIPNFAPV